MQISKREFLKSLGLVGAAGVTGAAFGDEFVDGPDKLPKGSCGDPANVWFGRHIFPLEPTMTDGPSCCLRDGRVLEPAKEIPVFHKTDVVVVGGGPAGFAAAVAAAKTGAKVALVERYGSLGGLFTNGMVLIMLSTSRRNAGGKWDLVTRGVCEEFMVRAGKPSYDTADTIGWCGQDGSHAAFPVVYRQLLPKKIDNLLCAGRCLGRGDTIDTFRLICPCFVTGEAAGTAAALAALKDTTPRALDVTLLRKTLAAHGASGPTHLDFKGQFGSIPLWRRS